MQELLSIRNIETDYSFVNQMIDNRDDISNETKVIFKEKNKKLVLSFLAEAKQIISGFCNKTKKFDTKHQHSGKCHRWKIGNTFKYCNRSTCRILKTESGARFTDEKIYRLNKLSKVKLLAKHGLFSTDIEKILKNTTRRLKIE